MKEVKLTQNNIPTADAFEDAAKTIRNISRQDREIAGSRLAEAENAMYLFGEFVRLPVFLQDRRQEFLDYILDYVSAAFDLYKLGEYERILNELEGSTSEE